MRQCSGLFATVAIKLNFMNQSGIAMMNFLFAKKFPAIIAL
jgi:hypothetical protein